MKNRTFLYFKNTLITGAIFLYLPVVKENIQTRSNLQLIQIVPRYLSMDSAEGWNIFLLTDRNSMHLPLTRT